MMKKLCGFLLIALATTSLCEAKAGIYAAEKAIEEYDFERLKSALRKLNRKKLPPQEKKELLEELHDSASDSADSAERNVSFFGSWSDMAKTGFGATGAFWGAAAVFAGQFFKDEMPSPLSWAVTLGGATVSAGGTYLLYKGLSCSTQRGWVEQARQIETYLENQVNDLE